MPIFIGEYQHNLDVKKRLAIPAKFMKELGKDAILTRGLDNCLFVFPSEQWREFAAKLGQHPNRSFVRLFLSGATEVDFDSLGRVLVPDNLKVYAGLKKEAVIIGVLNRLEIWDSQKWNSYKLSLEKDSDKVAEKLGELGII